MEAKNDEVKRANQLNESSQKAALLQLEAQYSEKLLDQKAKYECEKRRIFSYAADKFHRFFDPSAFIDESTYQNIISKVSEAIQDYEKKDASIRSVIGAQPFQSTDGAVAEFVLGKKKI